MPYDHLGEIGTLPIRDIAHLSGLEVLRGMIGGALPAPPFSRSMKVWLTEAEEGRVVFMGEPSADYFNPLGTVHGGWTAGILDSAMACAVHSLLKPGQTYTTTTMTLNYLRAVMPGQGDLRCEGVATYASRRIASAEGKLFDARGRLVAHAIESCMIMDMPTPAA
ncbi:MAG: PaaI family thioesterase [Bosea sp. (in: a-proteobacteria)]